MLPRTAEDRPNLAFTPLNYVLACGDPGPNEHDTGERTQGAGRHVEGETRGDGSDR